MIEKMIDKLTNESINTCKSLTNMLSVLGINIKQKILFCHVGGAMNTLLFLMGCQSGIDYSNTSVNQSEKVQKKDGIVQISVAQLHKITQQEKPIIVDVRTKQEYQASHIPNVNWIPLNELSSRISEIEAHKQDSVYMVCARGSRSHKAAIMLKNLGFSNPINVVGGTKGWIQAGYSVVK